jgi:ribosomal-protein-alanine N-acetyltransferase
MITDTVQHGVRLIGFVRLGLSGVQTAKLGFAIAAPHWGHQEGRLRDHVFTNGAWRDSILYSLLAHEWEAFR